MFFGIYLQRLLLSSAQLNKHATAVKLLSVEFAFTSALIHSTDVDEFFSSRAASEFRFSHFLLKSSYEMCSY